MTARSALSRFIVMAVLIAACRGKGGAVPPAGPDQTVADAMRLVCDAPARAEADRADASRSDRIAGHLSDGIGNVRVLQIVEGWKTDGIKKSELDALVREAKLPACALSKEAS